MGVLVLRIGGPRLVTAFSKSNMLPCTSSIKSFLSGNYPITYNYNKTIEEIIEANIAPLLATAKHLISLKMDELVIEQTKDFVFIFVCVDKITWKTKIQSSVPLEKLNECTLNGKILMFDDILNDELK